MYDPDRMSGAFYGFVNGDAYSTSYIHGLPAGSWNGNTAMMLALSESLLANGTRHAPEDQMERYTSIRWSKASHGQPFDAFDAPSIDTAIASYQHYGCAYRQRVTDYDNGKAGVLRLLPVVMLFGPNSGRMRETVQVTHGSQRELDCGELMIRILDMLLQGRGKEDVKFMLALLSETYAHDEVILHHVCRNKTADLDPSDSEVAQSMGKALRALYQTDSFEQGLALLQHGSSSAMFGMLAGAYYGCSKIPHGHLRDQIRLDAVLQGLSKLSRRRP